MCTRGHAPPPDRDEIRREVAGARCVPHSLVVHGSAAYWLEVEEGVQTLGILAPAESPLHGRFRGASAAHGGAMVARRCPADAANARALRAALPWLTPRPLGLQTSVGCGDRLGLATPGHVRALRRARRAAPDAPFAPIFAQQSIREMTRTERTPEDVLADATWGAFRGGWRRPVGADADHLKTEADVDACADAGYSLFTFDPGAGVDVAADTAAPEAIGRKVADLPWDALESSPADQGARYAGLALDLERGALVLTPEQAMRAAAKYGHAVADVARLYRHLAAKGIPFECEISVDETATPTTPAEHVYIAGELRRLGVRWVSLAPRYVGDFEKGIDYVGDLADFTADVQLHAAIARALGPYKLSLHSGSDKFRIYPAFAAATGGLAHLKTAGTSYVEALRVVARRNPGVFRRIVPFAADHYEAERASYHVSADARRVPNVDGLPEEVLPSLLDAPDTRQILHVTFGSTLAAFGPDIRATLLAHASDYEDVLARHFYRHLAPFVRAARRAARGV
jgi:hypothetical protein